MTCPKCKYLRKRKGVRCAKCGYDSDLTPLEPRRNGRPPLNINWDAVRSMMARGASIRMIRDELGLSHGTAQNAVNFIKAQREQLFKNKSALRH